MNILILDDEPKAARMLSGTVKEAMPGMYVATHTDYEAALAAAAKKKPDVAFLDIEIGNRSGLDAALELKKLNPRVNIIFVTAFSEYAVRSVSLHPSGYLMKPASVADVRAALDNLLYPQEPWRDGIYARTFGNFDLYVDGKLVQFSLSKSKEMLAYLVDRGGAGVNRKELAAAIFAGQEYTRKMQNYISKIYKNLEDSLKAAGAEKILSKGQNSYYVNKDELRCDLWDYLDARPEGLNAFHGEYMYQYDWADPAAAGLVMPKHRK